MVRLDINGKPNGTGFFVGVGLILTCNHVVKDKPVSGITVYWPHRDKTLNITKVDHPNPEVDLALLIVAETIAEQPIVMMRENPSERDQLQTFGFPDNRQEGDPGTFECVGLTGGRFPLIKFRSGQVRPGFSGSLLVHEASQKVCGVIKSTLDRGSDLGGLAIPMSVIWQVFPRLKLKNIPRNPFVPTTGMIDQPHQFFDRKRELRSVFDILNSGSSVAVIGPRQMGKSSLLKAVEHHAETMLIQSRYPVYLNLQTVEDDKDFYEALCEEIGVRVCRGYKLTQALKKLEPKVLLLLDEIEKMTWNGFTEQIRSQLRGLADGGEAPLRLVVSASVPLGELFTDSHGGVSPFQNICLEQFLPGWDKTMIQRLITERLADTPISFNDEEMGQIIEETEGHPQRVMVACFQLYNAYRDQLIGF